MITTTVISYDKKTCPSCGVHYAADSEFFRLKHEGRDAGGAWYCPNGHRLVFTQSKADQLAKELEQTKRQLTTAAGDRDYFAERLDETVKEKQILGRTLKASKTRLKTVKTRIAAGVCPGCNRTFKNLAAHMSTQHPGFGHAAE